MSKKSPLSVGDCVQIISSQGSSPEAVRSAGMELSILFDKQEKELQKSRKEIYEYGKEKNEYAKEKNDLATKYHHSELTCCKTLCSGYGSPQAVLRYVENHLMPTDPDHKTYKRGCIFQTSIWLWASHIQEYTSS